MRKLKVLGFLFITFINCNTVKSQVEKDYLIIDTAKIKCHYDYTFQQDSTDVNSVRKEDMILLVGNKKSIFEEYSKYYFDSTAIDRGRYWNNNEMMSFVKRNGPGNALCHFQVIKHSDLKKIITIPRVVVQKFHIEEPLNIIKWNLESKDISVKGGYKCQKATCHFAGRDYVAWYTMEVPISEGPYKFKGLPGLIVEIEDTQGEHRFELTQVTQTLDNKSLILYSKSRAIPSKMQDFVKALSNYNNGGINSLEQRGFSVENSNQAKIRKRMRARNNFIEKPEVE